MVNIYLNYTSNLYKSNYYSFDSLVSELFKNEGWRRPAKTIYICPQQRSTFHNILSRDLLISKKHQAQQRKKRQEIQNTNTYCLTVGIWIVLLGR